MMSVVTVEEENASFLRNFQEKVEKQQHINEQLDVLVEKAEAVSIEIIPEISATHEKDGISRIPEVCKTVTALLHKLPPIYLEIENALKDMPDDFSKPHDAVNRISQEFIGYATYVFYLEHKKLLSQDGANMLFRGEENADKGFSVRIYDLLIGYIDAIAELVRFAMNSATNGHHNMPHEIAEFVKPVGAAIYRMQKDVDCPASKISKLHQNISLIERLAYNKSARLITAQSMES